MDRYTYYLGFDIGGTKCAVVLGRTVSLPDGKAWPDRLPEILGRLSFDTRSVPAPEAALDRMCGLARQLCLQLEDRSLLAGAGIACGGPLDSRRGMILSPPNLPGWDQVPVTRIISQTLGLPAWLLNDADAGALAEWHFGSGQDCRNMIFLTFGTGFGAGLIVNGQLYSGPDDGAGEIGHIRISPTGPVGYGKAGSLEGFCSGGGIAQLARTLVMEQLQMGRPVAWCEAAGGLEALTARVVGEAADAGDPLAREILAVSGEHLGRGLAILLDLLNPEKIVIGSIFVRCRQWIWPAADRILRQESLERTYRRCQVVPAGLGESIGDLASLGIAMAGERGELV